MTNQTQGTVCRSETIRRLLNAAGNTSRRSAIAADTRAEIRRQIRTVGTRLTSAETFFQNRDCGCSPSIQSDDLRFACTSEAIAAAVLLDVDAFRNKLQRRRQKLATALEQCQIAERLSIHPKQSERAFQLHIEIADKLRQIDALYKPLPGIKGRALTCLKRAVGTTDSSLITSDVAAAA